jgi:hypothetical protein
METTPALTGPLLTPSASDKTHFRSIYFHFDHRLLGTADPDDGRAPSGLRPQPTDQRTMTLRLAAPLPALFG